MIDATHLHIGSWITILKKGGNYHYKISSGHDIEEIEKCPESVEPIPLTPEILEACGFEVPDRAVIAIKYLELSAKKYSFLLTDSLRNGIFSFRCNQLEINLEYLHQLQNLYFSITGKELTYSPNTTVK